MKVKDFLLMDVDIDVYDSIDGSLSVAFVGPQFLTAEGVKRFQKALDLEVTISDDKTCATVHIEKGLAYSPVAHDEARELFEDAAGYCSEREYDLLFCDGPDISITLDDIDIIEKLGWELLSIAVQNGQVYMEIENNSPEGEDLVETIWFNDGDDAATASRTWASSFDVNEHVELWIESRGDNGVPESITDLVADATAIQNMLFELADALAGKPCPVKEDSADTVNPLWERRCLRLDQEEFCDVLKAIYGAEANVFTADGLWVSAGDKTITDDELTLDLSKHFGRTVTEVVVDDNDPPTAIIFYV